MSEIEGKFIIQRIIRGREGEVKKITTRTIDPTRLAPRHLKDERVKGFLEAMKQHPDALVAIIENSRRIMRVIPLNVAGAFQSRLGLSPGE